MVGNNGDWVSRQDRTDGDRREYEKERLILWSLEAIHGAMERSGLNQTNVAERLGTTRANVSRAFSGRSNITLGTIADLAWASGMRAVLKLEPLRSGEFISSPVMLVSSAQPRVVNIGLNGPPCAVQSPSAEWVVPCYAGEK